MSCKKRIILCILMLYSLISSISVHASTNEEIVYSFLRNELGLNQAAACGVLANIKHESSFNPHSTFTESDGSVSYGICQWNGGRRTALENYCGSNYSTLQGQLYYLKHELETTEKNSWNNMDLLNIPNTESGAATAAYKWARYFERCAVYYCAEQKRGYSYQHCAKCKYQYGDRENTARTVYWPKYSDIESVQNQYVDVGNDFYAYIVNNNTDILSWKHVGIDGGKVELQEVYNNSKQLWHFERQSDMSYKITNANSGCVLDDLNWGTSGNIVGAGYSNDSTAQRWFISGENGSYHLHPSCARNCSLDIAGGSGNAGTTVQIWETNTTGAQKFQLWKIDIIPSTLTTSVAMDNVTFKWNMKEYADVYNIRIYRSEWESGDDYSRYNFPSDGAILQLPNGHYYAAVEACNSIMQKRGNIVEFDVKNERVDVGTGFYAYIVNNNTDIDLWKHVGINENNNVELQDVENSSRQIWYFERQSDMSYKIKNAKNGLILDDMNFGGAGSNVITGGSNDTTAQRWFVSGLNGDYHLHPACALDCSMDITSGSGKTGTNVQIWETNTTGAQRFQLWKIMKPNLYPVTPSFTSDTKTKTVHISWDPAENATGYDVRIYKKGAEEIFHMDWNIHDTFYDMVLESGEYEVSIATLNERFHDYYISEKYEFEVSFPQVDIESSGEKVRVRVSGIDNIKSQGLVYAKNVENVTLETAGRIRITFTGLSDNGILMFDASGLLGYSFRGYVIYEDENGNEIIEYSDPMSSDSIR